MTGNEQRVKDILEQITVEQVYKEEQFILNDVHSIAINFLNKYNEVLLKWQNLQFQVNSDENLKNKLEKVYKYMRESTDFTREILQVVHSFENALNELFGKVIYLTYVEQSGELKFYDEIEIGKIYSEATKNKGRGNISQGNVLKREEAQMTDQLKIALKRSIQNKKDVYVETLRRYEEDSKEEHMNYDPSKNTFWWRLQNNYPQIGWTKPFANRGWIAEGYAEAVLEDSPNFSNNNLESSIERLWGYMNINSKPAAIQQDLVFGRVEFAVKSGDFSTPRIGQFVRLAEGMKFLKNETMNIDYFKKVVPKLINLKTISEKSVENAENKVRKQILKEAKIMGLT